MWVAPLQNIKPIVKLLAVTFTATKYSSKLYYKFNLLAFAPNRGISESIELIARICNRCEEELRVSIS